MEKIKKLSDIAKSSSKITRQSSTIHPLTSYIYLFYVCYVDFPNDF